MDETLPHPRVIFSIVNLNLEVDDPGAIVVVDLVISNTLDIIYYVTSS